MVLSSILAVSIGGALGSLLRWWFGLLFNPIFPTIPLGTLAVNLLGGFLMGLFMGIVKNHAFVPEAARLAIATGFIGGFTTFSTFSAETVTLLTQQQFLWTSVIVVSHTVGSIAATFLGLYVVQSRA